MPLGAGELDRLLEEFVVRKSTRLGGRRDTLLTTGKSLTLNFRFLFGDGCSR